LTVLCSPENSDKLQEEILLKTSTLGVRRYEASRMVADRDWDSVQFDGSEPIRIKIARDRKGNIIHTQPEYEDCAASALRLGLPLEDVFKKVLRQYQDARELKAPQNSR